MSACVDARGYIYCWGTITYDEYYLQATKPLKLYNEDGGEVKVLNS